MPAITLINGTPEHSTDPLESYAGELYDALKLSLSALSRYNPDCALISGITSLIARIDGVNIS